jgi:hypothetical protein
MKLRLLLFPSLTVDYVPMTVHVLPVACSNMTRPLSKANATARRSPQYVIHKPFQHDSGGNRGHRFLVRRSQKADVNGVHINTDKIAAFLRGFGSQKWRIGLNWPVPLKSSLQIIDELIIN